MENKILVAYFVQKGKEKESVSKKVADALGDALKNKGYEFSTFAIEPVESYPEDKEKFEAVTRMEKEVRHRPELVGKYSGMKYVERLLLVTPNWWEDMPMGVYSFLDKYDFAEKRIVPVVVHQGSGENDITSSLREFVQKVWVLPAVEVSASEVGTPAEKEAVEKAIEELFQPSK
ncbi:MAG: hypothetical protein K2N03_05235 [Muribaculaceae bacterium]|nr:hypothetical protein [Muribaculaceae bacterium]